MTILAIQAKFHLHRLCTEQYYGINTFFFFEAIDKSHTKYTHTNKNFSFLKKLAQQGSFIEKLKFCKLLSNIVYSHNQVLPS